jgi:hypothetical protein
MARNSRRRKQGRARIESLHADESRVQAERWADELFERATDSALAPAADPGAGWRKVLRDKDHPGMLVRRHLEVCVFSCLAAELRGGGIAAAGSDSYANLHDQLMFW